MMEALEEYDNDSREYESYLEARDSSIVLGWNMAESKGNSNNDHSDRSKELDASDDCILLPDQVKNPPYNKDEGINVHLRIKKSNVDTKLYTIEDKILICAVPEGSHAARNKREGSTVSRKFKFTNIFDQETSQKHIFDSIIKAKILNFINGNNSTVLAYGASGSGKTFTMIGTEEQPGIIPRSLDYFFRTLESHVNKKPIAKPLPDGGVQFLTESQTAQELSILKNILADSKSQAEQVSHSKTFSHMQRRLSINNVGTLNKFTPILAVWVSFAEIYNENIYDLLQPDPGRHQQRPRLRIGGLQDETYIRGLKYVFVQSGLEAYRLLHYGMHNLSYAATAVNEHSSRSHCIFSIRLASGYNQKNCNVSIFNFCDLAGSERLKKTLNVGERLRESTKINSSLSVLGRCISSIKDMQQGARGVSTAPFRDSKLTILFQKALQGKEDISMIVNINASPDMYDDTQHVLMFSAVAQEITTRVEPKILKRSRYSAYNKNLLNYVIEEKENDERNEEITKLRNEKADLVLELTKQKELFDKEMEEERNYVIENHEKRFNILSKQVTALKQENKQLEKSKVLLERQVRQLKMELIEKEQVITFSSNKDSGNEGGETENKDLEYKIAAYQLEVEGLKDKNQKLKEDVKELVAKYLEQERIYQEQGEEIQELRDTLSDSKMDFESLSNELERHKKSVQELTSEIVELSDKRAFDEQELEDLRQQNYQLRQEIENMEAVNEVTQPLGLEDDKENAPPLTCR
ncbi:unnamed protein product [Ceutorhynchus assimilis]|uniref:Kinesin motor domain-containing protein n=1 Tax=Ceutorhynchus assimilis TaxID=467358 RepID=A0A9N9MVI6_9CUCU|nr:unnamed protein product [Ceutorhynchus assimilis]